MACLRGRCKRSDFHENLINEVWGQRRAPTLSSAMIVTRIGALGHVRSKPTHEHI